MQKKKLVVMYGGPGGEHEVSVKSGENVFGALDKNKYEVEKVLLPKNFKKFRQVQLDKWRQEKVLVLPIMHGKFGEGGELQSILEKNKIKFIGCTSSVSKVSIDKFATQKVLIKNKIMTPKTFVVKKLADILKIPEGVFIVKQNDGGSSVDLFKTKNKNELEKAVKIMLRKYGECLVQEFVEGREFTCGVIQNQKKIIALPVTEIVLTKGELFDYEAKYSVGGCEEVTPAKIDDNLRTKVQTVSKKVFKVLGCRDLGRVDMILGSNNKLYVLEINTMPGMTGTSLIPQQLANFHNIEDSILEEVKAAGMSVGTFFDIMIGNER
jgi:D-alanine-D-alanine ligase